MAHGPLRLWQVMVEQFVGPITKRFSHAMSAQFAADAVRFKAVLQDLGDVTAAEWSIYADLRWKEKSVPGDWAPSAKRRQPIRNTCPSFGVEDDGTAALLSLHKPVRNRDSVDYLTALLDVLDSKT